MHRVLPCDWKVIYAYFGIKSTPDSKVHGANMGPTMGPMLAPWTLLSGTPRLLCTWFVLYCVLLWYGANRFYTYYSGLLLPNGTFVRLHKCYWSTTRADDMTTTIQNTTTEWCAYPMRHALSHCHHVVSFNLPCMWNSSRCRSTCTYMDKYLYCTLSHY